METDMTKGSPAKLIAGFIVPLIIGNIFQQLYSMVDTIIVGQYCGAKALAAVGSTGTIMFLIIGFSAGLCTGFTVLTAQRFGAGDMKGMRKSVTTAVYLSIGVALVLTVFSCLAMSSILKIMQTPEDIFDMAYSYIITICAGMICTIMYNLLASLMRAIGNSKLPLYTLMLASGLNIVLDLVCIVNFKMGVFGAALATVVSQGVAAILCILYILKKVEILKFEKDDWRFDGHLANVEMSIGIPMGLQFSITAIGTMMVQTALNMLGSMAVAAYTVSNKIEMLVTQPFLAMGQTMATYAGQNWGMNDYKRINRGIKVACVMTAVYGVVIFGVVMIAAPRLVTLFVSENLGEITALNGQYILVTGLFYVPLGLIFIFRNALQSCGYAFLPTMGGVVELVLRAIVAVAAGFVHSFRGVCFANSAAWVGAAVFLWIGYVYKFKPLLKKQE